ncbi:MAG TPA: response regulator [Flavitalea sp.]|nr:response regulator [Flavitalea sp.]
MKQENRYIAIVDDDEDDRSFLEEAFHENGCNSTIQTFDNGVKLLETLRNANEKPLLIIIDLHMPRKSGREILTELKHDKNLFTIPVIVLSTALSSETREEMLRAGANCIISKPNNYNDILFLTKSIAKIWNVE